MKTQNDFQNPSSYKNKKEKNKPLVGSMKFYDLEYIYLL